MIYLIILYIVRAIVRLYFTMPKLLEITRSYYPSVGGLEKFVADRLKIYNALNIDYTLITTDFTSNKRDNSLSEQHVITLRQYTPYNITPSLKHYITSDYDFVSVNMIGRHFSDVAIREAHKKNIPIIVTPHLFFHTERYKLLKRLYKRLFLPNVISKIDVLIVFTEVEKQFWIEQFSFPEHKIVVIPHYITAIQAENEQYSGKPYIFYLGRADKYKEVDLLIKAFFRAKIRDYNLVLTVYKSDLGEDSRQIVDEYPSIKLLGHISEQDKYSYLSNCEAVVLPTRFEAFGITLLEAFAHKKPILCSDIAVLREIHDENGVIFFENSVDSLSEALTQFSELSLNQKSVMGEVNFRNLEKYRFDRVLTRYSEIFRL